MPNVQNLKYLKFKLVSQVKNSNLLQNGTFICLCFNGRIMKCKCSCLMIKRVTGICNNEEKAFRSLLKHGTTFFSCATDLELYYSATANNLQIQPVTHFNIYWEENESPRVTIYDFVTDTIFSQSSTLSVI